MLVFQVLCSLKPGEASMAYSLRSDMKCCIKHQVKERELDIPISSDDQFKEVVSVNTKTKQNTHLFESQSGIHCFIVFFIFSFQNISPLIKLFRVKSLRKDHFWDKVKEYYSYPCGNTFHNLNPKVLISIDTYTPKDPWFKQKVKMGVRERFTGVNKWNWLFPNILITV